MKVFKNYSNFKGRARRAEYWGFTFINFLITLLGYLFYFGLESSEFEEMIIIFLIIAIIYLVGTFLPSLAVTVRRLHDIGKSGLWTLLGFIPYIGAFILLILTCKDSQKGSNRYGENPKGE